jgi:hypothetical protein
MHLYGRPEAPATHLQLVQRLRRSHTSGPATSTRRYPNHVVTSRYDSGFSRVASGSDEVTTRRSRGFYTDVMRGAANKRRANTNKYGDAISQLFPAQFQEQRSY